MMISWNDGVYPWEGSMSRSPYRDCMGDLVNYVTGDYTRRVWGFK